MKISELSIQLKKGENNEVNATEKKEEKKSKAKILLNRKYTNIHKYVHKTVDKSSITEI